jgi:signal transduction histidine kinase
VSDPQAEKAGSAGVYAKASSPGVPDRKASLFARLRMGDLKREASLFLMLLLTFAAVLGRQAIVERSLILDEQAGQYPAYDYYAYVYTDTKEGGKSSINADLDRPMSWSCDLKPVYAYPYCAYGLNLTTKKTPNGQSLAPYQNITLRFQYHGVGDRLRFIFRTKASPAIAKTIKDDIVPVIFEAHADQGNNEITISPRQLAPEGWWLDWHHVKLEDVKFSLDQVTAIEVISGNQTPPGAVAVKLQSIAFQGSYVSAAQWYLLILGAWLVVTGVFLVARFFSVRREYEERQRLQEEQNTILADARAAAEAASSAKSQFLANMSHELRTPLNAIIGYADLVLRRKDNDEQLQSAVKTIRFSGEHLLSVITDILDIAKVEAGKLELLPESFDLHACLTGVGEMICQRAGEKGLRFVMAMDQNVPRIVVADQKRLRQVLINLLGNAVKFTKEGEIRLSVTAEATAVGTTVRFEVSDTGAGIAQDQIDRIFEAFEQSGNAADRSGGTGLGLSITRRIVEMMGGAIMVDSELGRGSTFRVEVPLCLGAAEDIAGDLSSPDLPEPESVGGDEATVIKAPAGAIMEKLLVLAREGNMKAIRKEIPSIMDLGPQYEAFALRLDVLAAGYQSPAVLRLVETAGQASTAA